MKIFRFVSSLVLAVLMATCLSAQNVVVQWNGIASTTIVANGGKPSATSSVWFAYASIAVYDAVNAIRRDWIGSANTSVYEDLSQLYREHRVCGMQSWPNHTD
jgi:hypothetical protein